MSRADTTIDALAWRVEQACINAWPCTRQVLRWPWLIRLQGGPVRRVNSVNPLCADAADDGHELDVMLNAARALFESHDLALLIRSSGLTPGLDAALDLRGFSREGETGTLYAARPTVDAQTDPELGTSAEPDAGWLTLRQTVAPADETTQRLLRQTVGAIALPRAFASLRRRGRAVAIAYGVLDRDLLVLEAVATAPDQRRRGYGRRVVAGLLRWAAAQGARQACLQVTVDNTAARRLYRTLGFDRELYRYRYHRPGKPR